MGRFGFSYVGLAYLLMLFIPNLIWTRRQPAGYGDASKRENRFLHLLEQCGQVLVTCCALIFSDYNLSPRTWTPWGIWLAVSLLFMALYEVCWIRYFKSRRTMRDMYRPFLGIPFPLATLPVAAFLLLGIYGRVIWMIAAALLLGIGHIGIHWQHWRDSANL